MGRVAIFLASSFFNYRVNGPCGWSGHYEAAYEVDYKEALRRLTLRRLTLTLTGYNISWLTSCFREPKMATFLLF
jgi:hypothetical protein